MYIYFGITIKSQKIIDVFIMPKIYFSVVSCNNYLEKLKTSKNAS
jgi:hypothetical protein